MAQKQREQTREKDRRDVTEREKDKSGTERKRAIQRDRRRCITYKIR